MLGGVMLPNANKSHVSAVAIALVVCGFFIVSCKREERDFRVEPPAAQSLQAAIQSRMRWNVSVARYLDTVDLSS